MVTTRTHHRWRTVEMADAYLRERGIDPAGPVLVDTNMPEDDEHGPDVWYSLGLVEEAICGRAMAEALFGEDNDDEDDLYTVKLRPAHGYWYVSADDGDLGRVWRYADESQARRVYAALVAAHASAHPEASLTESGPDLEDEQFDGVTLAVYVTLLVGWVASPLLPRSALVAMAAAGGLLLAAAVASFVAGLVRGSRG